MTSSARVVFSATGGRRVCGEGTDQATEEHFNGYDGRVHVELKKARCSIYIGDGLSSTARCGQDALTCRVELSVASARRRPSA